MSAAEPLPRECAYPIEPDEHCNRSGAEALKAKIEAYWRERGAIVHCRIEPKGFTAALRAARYDVRSDLLNGWPRMRALPQEHSNG